MGLLNSILSKIVSVIVNSKVENIKKQLRDDKSLQQKLDDLEEDYQSIESTLKNYCKIYPNSPLCKEPFKRGVGTGLK
ncbi:MAG: hypothetical protein R2771_13040 [Saprospiraceae bacterium]